MPELFFCFFIKLSLINIRNVCRYTTGYYKKKVNMYPIIDKIKMMHSVRRKILDNDKNL